MEDKQAFYVESTDGRKFKMVIRGDLSKLTVIKIRRYLKSYGITDELDLYAGSRRLTDEMTGEDFHLQTNDVLYLREAATPAPQLTATTAGANSVFGLPLQNAWADDQHGEKYEKYAGANGNAIAMLRSELEDAKYKNEQLEKEVRRLREERQQKETGTSGVTSSNNRAASASPTSPTASAIDRAKESLDQLSRQLRVPLHFDRNMTCVVGTDADFSIMLTYDSATERLYIYSTLLTELPSVHEVRVKLYEILLEGSLLSREVCGGGIGLSSRNGTVVLTTSLPMRHCSTAALADVMPGFVETVERWRSLVSDLIE